MRDFLGMCEEYATLVERKQELHRTLQEAKGEDATTGLIADIADAIEEIHIELQILMCRLLDDANRHWSQGRSYAASLS